MMRNEKKKKRQKRRILRLALSIFALLAVANITNITRHILPADIGLPTWGFSKDGQASSSANGFFADDALAGMDTDGIPDSLLQLAENNPETAQFVRDYPDKNNVRQDIDISADLTGDIPLFLQWDERWGYLPYGGNFMALNGCGPTCLSMVYCGLTGNTKWDPYKVAQMAEDKGFYIKGSGSSWELMTGGAAEMGLYADNIPFDEEHILRALQQGQPIICVMGPGDFTTQGHFIVLTDIASDGTIRVHDPNSRERSKSTWELSRLLPQIRNLWAYSL